MRCFDTDRSIFIGFDPRPQEIEAFAVARKSIKRRLTQPTTIHMVSLDMLRTIGLYTRPTTHVDGRLFDVISNAPMATEFAVSRFLVPHLAGTGLALFVDCDVMARADVGELFDNFDYSKACMCVQHDYTPRADHKMVGQAQLPYERKNWSSVVVWNCDHPKVKFLTPEVVNAERGLWLHQFSWLHDDDIGHLDPGWNYLVGDSPLHPDPKLVHFTNGTPNMAGHEDCEYADEWRANLGAA